MEVPEQAVARGARAAAPGRAAKPRSRGRLFGGGTAGNEQLTAITGVVLIVLLAVIGITILRIHQLISVHLFVGLLLLGPVALKMGSTGYRFARYYTRNQLYREKGPPDLALRLVAPGVVVSTIVVFVSGILLMLRGPQGRDQYLLLHKASFIVWLGFTALHVLGHLPGLSRSLRLSSAGTTGSGLPASELADGGAGRMIVVAGALVAGIVLAIVLIPQFGSWTGQFASVHEH